MNQKQEGFSDMDKRLIYGVGIGAAAVALYLYLRKKKSVVSAPAAPASKPFDPTKFGYGSVQLGDLASGQINTGDYTEGISNEPETKEEACRRIYMTSPKPAVVQSDEYWRRHEENFMKDCLVRDISEQRDLTLEDIEDLKNRIKPSGGFFGYI